MDLQGFGHLLLSGTWVTLQLAFCSLLCGLVLGVWGATASMSRVAVIRWLAVTYNTLIRGLPELLLVLVLYYGVPEMVLNLSGHSVEIAAFWAGVIALSIAFGAYATEVFRSALMEIPQGQREAAMALGLNRPRIFRHITLPQVWRIALPGLGNLFLVLLKDTALVSVVGLNDLMRQTTVALQTTKQPFTFYFAAALIYLSLTIVFMQVNQRLEKWSNRGYRREGGRA